MKIIFSIEQDVVGNGHPGMADGEINQVEFDSPRGMAEYNSCIYIPDTNNHAIRVVKYYKRMCSSFHNSLLV